MIATAKLLRLFTLLWLTGISAYVSEEQTLLDFARQLSNFKEVTEAHQWQGWGLDNNTLCPPTQITTTQELWCEPGYPGGIQHSSQSWTGVTCTPDGYVTCLSLSSWGLHGNASALLQLAALTHMQFLNLANNTLTGVLPASFPHAFSLENAGECWLSVVYLSNNSISGSLPALWGDKHLGWRQSLQRLYLSDNQITGQLPQLWSHSNSLWKLSRLDLFGNQMIGTISWNLANMPSLQNLVLLPGNSFCGTVPYEFDGVLRNYVGDDGRYQVLANVTALNATCAPDHAGTIGTAAFAATVGSALAAFLGVVVAVWLWWFIWHSKGGFARKPYRDLPGIGNVLRWQRESAYFSDRADSQPNISTLSILTDSSEAATNTNKTVNSLIASSTYARTEPAAVHSMSDKCLLASTAKPQRSSEGTVFFTSRPVMTEVSHVHWPTSQQIFQPKPQTLFIPAPLWQDVEIASENICIAQTSAGTDWILGQGSYGMVYKGIKDGVHDVAIKIFKSVTTERDLELLQTEIAVLRSCNNRNIVHFYGVCFKQTDAWLVMELLEKGNLYNALAYGKGLCTWYNRGAGIALDIAKGLHFLHSHHVMHLDLKSPNILLALDGTAKIADVGLSRMFTTRSLPVAKNTGTFHWMAPELISAGRCTEKADIFSFGVVLYEILTAEQPIRGRLKPVQ
ncbi:TPA: hypothetical protein ACH3X2_005947 [Trebouxia sp. C0005]